MNDVILPNELTLDEHVQRILDAKLRVQVGIIEMAITIVDAVNQLGDDDTFQEELADRIGMSQGTLSKWVSIGSNESLLNFRNKLPGSFTTLYQLTVLDNQYQKYYGEDEGKTKFHDIIEHKISPETESSFVVEFQKEHREFVKTSKSQETQSKIENAFGKSTELKGNVFSLETLLQSKKYFSTFVVTPTKSQLSRWKNLELDEYIYDEFPVAELRKTAHSGTLKIIFQITTKDIETALKCLYGFGFVYRDTLIPNNTKTGFNKSDSPVFVIGERGHSKSDDVTLTSSNLSDVLGYAEQVGSSPYLLIGSTTDNKSWTCIVE